MPKLFPTPASYERKDIKETLIGRTIVNMYTESGYIYFELDNGETFSAHSDYIFDKENMYFDIDKLDWK